MFSYTIKYVESCKSMTIITKRMHIFIFLLWTITFLNISLPISLEVKTIVPVFLRRNEKVLNNRPSLTSNSRVKNLSSAKSKSFSLYHYGLSVNEMSAISSKYFEFSYIVCVPIMPEYLSKEKE